MQIQTEIDYPIPNCPNYPSKYQRFLKIMADVAENTNRNFWHTKVFTGTIPLDSFVVDSKSLMNVD